MNQDPFNFGPCSANNDNLVDKLIGNAYQVVKYVAMNMPKLALVSDNMVKLTLVSDNMAPLITVATALPEILVLNTNLATVVEVATALPQILLVGNNIAAVNNVSTNMTAVINAPQAALLAQQWATKTDGEVITGLGYGAKYYAEQAAATLASKTAIADLSNFADPVKGAALVGFAPGLAYAANTVGAFVKTLQPKPVVNADSPTTGTAAVGDRSVNNAVARATPVLEWVCTAAGTPGTWRALSWLVFMGTTLERPTLPANAGGVVYLDTTLAAAGKPITWNGALWVDATGASV